MVPGRLIAFPNHRLLHSAYGTTRQMLGPVAYIPGRHDASLWPTGDSMPACTYVIPTTSASCLSNYEAILSQAACATAAQALASWSGTSSLFSTSTGCADTSTGACGATGQWPTGVSGARVCVLDTGSGSASLAPWLYDDSAVPAQRIICIASGCATPTTMPMPEGCQWVLGDVTSTQDSCDDVCSVLGKACRQAELDTLEAAYTVGANSRNYELIKNTFAAAGFSPQSVSEDCELNVNQCVQWGMPARHSTLPTCMAGVPFASCGQVFPRPSVQHLSCCARWETSAHGGNFSETPQLTECDGRRQLIFNIAACVRAARHQIPSQPPSFLLPPQRLQLAQHRHLLTLPPLQRRLLRAKQAGIYGVEYARRVRADPTPSPAAHHARVRMASREWTKRPQHRGVSFGFRLMQVPPPDSGESLKCLVPQARWKSPFLGFRLPASLRRVLFKNSTMILRGRTFMVQTSLQVTTNASAASVQQRLQLRVSQFFSIPQDKVVALLSESAPARRAPAG